MDIIHSVLNLKFMLSFVLYTFKYFYLSESKLMYPFFVKKCLTC